MASVLARTPRTHEFDHPGGQCLYQNTCKFYVSLNCKHQVLAFGAACNLGCPHPILEHLHFHTDFTFYSNSLLMHKQLAADNNLTNTVYETQITHLGFWLWAAPARTLLGIWGVNQYMKNHPFSFCGSIFLLLFLFSLSLAPHFFFSF